MSDQHACENNGLRQHGPKGVISHAEATTTLASIPPVSRLPFELLLLIFALSPDHGKIRSHYQLVCKDWQAAILACHVLWTHFDLMHDALRPSVFAERAGQLSLFVTAEEWFPDLVISDEEVAAAHNFHGDNSEFEEEPDPFAGVNEEPVREVYVDENGVEDGTEDEGQDDNESNAAPGEEDETEDEEADNVYHHCNHPGCLAFHARSQKETLLRLVELFKIDVMGRVESLVLNLQTGTYIKFLNLLDNNTQVLAPRLRNLTACVRTSRKLPLLKPWLSIIDAPNLRRLCTLFVASKDLQKNLSALPHLKRLELLALPCSRHTAWPGGIMTLKGFLDTFPSMNLTSLFIDCADLSKSFSSTRLRATVHLPRLQSLHIIGDFYAWQLILSSINIPDAASVLLDFGCEGKPYINEGYLETALERLGNRARHRLRPSTFHLMLNGQTEVVAYQTRRNDGERMPWLSIMVPFDEVLQRLYWGFGPTFNTLVIDVAMYTSVEAMTNPVLCAMWLLALAPEISYLQLPPASGLLAHVLRWLLNSPESLPNLRVVLVLEQNVGLESLQFVRDPISGSSIIVTAPPPFLQGLILELNGDM